MPHIKVIIQSTTNWTWSGHTGLTVKNSGGKTLYELLDDRANAVRDALIDLGVPENQVEIGNRPLYGGLDEMDKSSFQLKFDNK